MLDSVAHQGSTLPVVIMSRGRVLSTHDGESLLQATGFCFFFFFFLTINVNSGVALLIREPRPHGVPRQTFPLCPETFRTSLKWELND